ncbi:MAG: hypothetical protein NZ561_02570 [Phycisphaerae bacterium]|nr:hypothetical protein [Phycisphaerae bacterium]MDW8262610.1 hypothetical protein [Phycisphaerales bacterium]
MVRAAFQLVGIGAILAIASLGAWQFRKYTAERREIARLQRQRDELARRAEQLLQVVARLTAERRVAEVLVTDRTTDPSGVPISRLLFVEYARDGSTLPPRQFTVLGERVHIDGLVIEFPSDFLQKDDPLRGHSLLLFEKIYGSAQSPDSAERIDTPGRVPDLYRATAPSVSQFEQELWSSFWRLAEDPAFRASKGVKVATGKSVYGPFRIDRLYTITLDAGGKLSVTDEPLKGAVGEALRRLSSARQ